MRLCRFGDNRLGLVRQERVIDVTPVSIAFPAFDIRCQSLTPLSRNWTACASTSKSLQKISKGIPIGDVRFISPIANPGKIVGGAG